jgi:WD40 repeat protein
MTDQAVVREMQQTQDQNRGRWEALYLQGVVHMERDDLESAVAAFTDAVRLAPNEIRPRELLGTAQSRLRTAGCCTKSLHGHTSAIWAVCFSLDGRLLLSGSTDKTVRLWETSTGHCIRIFEGHTDAVLSVCFSPHGALAASGSLNRDKAVRIWDLASGQCLNALREHGYRVRSLCFSPDGKCLLVGGEGHPALYDVAAGQIKQTLKGHKGEIHAVCFSADGKLVLSGGDDCTLRLWEVATGRCLTVLQVHDYVKAASLIAFRKSNVTHA